MIPADYAEEERNNAAALTELLLSIHSIDSFHLGGGEGSEEGLEREPRLLAPVLQVAPVALLLLEVIARLCSRFFELRKKRKERLHLLRRSSSPA